MMDTCNPLFFPCVCALRESYADLFGGFASLSPNAGTSYAESSLAVPDYFVYQFMHQCNNHVYSFISDIMDFFNIQCLAVNRSD